MSCGCGTKSTRCVQFEPDVQEWLEAIGALVKPVDACTGHETGVCVTSLSGLARALQLLCPDAVSVHDYVAKLNALAGLSHIQVWLNALAAATPAEKEAVQAAIVACVRSPAAGNGLTVAPDGGLRAPAPPVALTGPAVAALIGASLPARQALAADLLSGDANNSATLGSDGLIFENDGV